MLKSETPILRGVVGLYNFSVKRKGPAQTRPFCVSLAYRRRGRDVSVCRGGGDWRYLKSPDKPPSSIKVKSTTQVSKTAQEAEQGKSDHVKDKAFLQQQTKKYSNLKTATRLSTPLHLTILTTRATAGL